jgi:hypothetical protein
VAKLLPSPAEAAAAWAADDASGASLRRLEALLREQGGRQLCAMVAAASQARAQS